MICIEIEIKYNSIKYIDIFQLITLQTTVSNIRLHLEAFYSVHIMSIKCRLEIDSMEIKKRNITFFTLYIDGTFLQVNICYINANNKEKYTVFIS